MNDAATTILPRLPRPVALVCKRLMSAGSQLHASGQLDVAPMPWEGEQAVAMTVYPPMDWSSVSQFEQLHSLDIPSKYRDVLLCFNGLFAFDLSLYGVPASILSDPPHLDRSVQQCHDLLAANRNWKLGYNVDETWFHFGSRAYTDDANTGYFLDAKGWILSYLEDGTRVGRWKSVDSFLKTELAAAEALVSDEFPHDWPS